MGYIKDLHNNEDLVITIARLFLGNRQAKNIILIHSSALLDLNKKLLTKADINNHVKVYMVAKIVHR